MAAGEEASMDVVVGVSKMMFNSGSAVAETGIIGVWLTSGMLDATMGPTNIFSSASFGTLGFMMYSRN